MEQGDIDSMSFEAALAELEQIALGPDGQPTGTSPFDAG